MIEIKTFVSIVAILLTFIAYIPYLRDTLKKKTSPHIYTWFIWGISSAITYGLQVSDGAGVGAWVTLAVTILTFIVLFLGLRNGKKDITISDTIFFLLSFIALLLWLIAQQPTLSVILVSTIGIIALIPTIRKSWNYPYSETLITYELVALRYGFCIFALQNYSVITLLSPLTWGLASVILSMILIIRRRQVSK